MNIHIKIPSLFLSVSIFYLSHSSFALTLSSRGETITDFDGAIIVWEKLQVCDHSDYFNFIIIFIKCKTDRV